MKTNNTTKNNAWRAAAISTVLGCSSTAAAQQETLATIAVDTAEPAESAPERGRASDTVQLEEVIVTATKTERRLRDIPASITSQSGEDLERRGAQSAEDILKTVPGANITYTGDSPARVTIRGISSDVATSPTTGILFGDVSFTDTYVPFVALDPNPFDLESVEVLKGPQGTLFGASALNGAVRYVAKKPVFGQWDARYFGQYTAVAHGGIEPSYGGAVNVPLGSDDELALRVVGFVRNQPGWIDNQRLGKDDANNLDQAGARGMLAWKPDEAWDLGLTYAWQKTQAHDPAVANNHDGELSNDNRPRLSYNNTHYNFVDLSVKRSFDWADVTSDTGYVVKGGHNFFDASPRFVPTGPFPIVAQEYFAHSNTVSQELRFSSPKGNGSPWRWVGGGFFFDQRLKERLQVPLGGDGASVEQLLPLIEAIAPGLASQFATTGQADLDSGDLDVRVREIALFGEVTRELFDDFELTVGGRLYKTQSGGTNTQSGIAVLALYQTTAHIVDETIHESGFNPKASLTWHVTHDVLAYVATSKGFRVGGVQPGLVTPLSSNPGPSVFKSDTIWNYEGGLRTQWFNNTLHVDLTAFHEDWKKPQTVQNDGSGLGVYIDNVGGVQSTGADLAVDWLVSFVPGLKLSFAGSYARTETTKSYTSASGDTAAAGTPWPLAPRWQTASTVSYLRPVDNWLLGSQLTHTYLGGSISDIVSRRPIFGYQQWDAQLSVANPAISWLPEIALSVNNIGDERGIVNRFASTTPTAETAASEVYYLQPRTVILRLSGHFGN
ncbi:TonB-dependent receptor [Hydrocarboniphaga sp.]|uniref:TonB-dependent receptor n=1 Tax=Hydrocarboniphaga sp. TaxID=2033016 RepID=UPI003D13ABF7